jgi:hypothetical protein
MRLDSRSFLGMMRAVLLAVALACGCNAFMLSSSPVLHSSTRAASSKGSCISMSGSALIVQNKGAEHNEYDPARCITTI